MPTVREAIYRGLAGFIGKARIRCDHISSVTREIDSADRNWVCSANQPSELRQDGVVFAVAEIAGFNFTNTEARSAFFFTFRARWSPNHPGLALST